MERDILKDFCKRNVRMDDDCQPVIVGAKGSAYWNDGLPCIYDESGKILVDMTMFKETGEIVVPGRTVVRRRHTKKMVG